MAVWCNTLRLRHRAASKSKQLAKGATTTTFSFSSHICMHCIKNLYTRWICIKTRFFIYIFFCIVHIESTDTELTTRVYKENKCAALSRARKSIYWQKFELEQNIIIMSLMTIEILRWCFRDHIWPTSVCGCGERLLWLIKRNADENMKAHTSERALARIIVKGNRMNIYRYVSMIQIIIKKKKTII